MLQVSEASTSFDHKLHTQSATTLESVVDLPAETESPSRTKLPTAARSVVVLPMESARLARISDTNSE